MEEKHRTKSLLLGFLVSPHCYSTNRCSRVGPTLYTESGRSACGHLWPPHTFLMPAQPRDAHTGSEEASWFTVELSQ